MRILLLAILFAGLGSKAQETKWAYETFKDTRIVNGHSVEVNPKGEMKYIISHRFGALNSGFYNAFGLDQATMRQGFDFGISDRLTIGLGRSSFQKTIDGYLKYKLAYQRSGKENVPVSITLLTGSAYRGLNFPEDIPYPASARFSFTNQVLIARKFSDRFSAQIMPTHVHLNLVELRTDQNDVFSLGMAAHYQVTYAFALNTEFYFTPENQLSSLPANCFSLGLEFKTKAHVFQLNFSNSQGMTEKFFVTETAGSWREGRIHFGFNITRDFKIFPKAYK